MAQITSHEELEAWLKDKPADWAQVIAARGALRVLPYPIIKDIYDEWIANYLLALIRALVISWASCNFPAHDMRSAARTAADAADYVSRSSATSIIYATSAAYSVTHATYAIVEAPELLPFIASRSSAHAADAAADAAGAAARAAVWANIDHDCNWLTSNGSSASASRRLTREPLWPVGEPEGWAEAWVSATGRLAALNQDYDVWIDWYNRRIEGYTTAFDIPGDSDRTEDKAILARLADATDEDFWDKGAAHVNTTLQGWIDDARKRVALPPVAPAPIPPQNQNAIPFSATEDGKIRIDLSRNADALRTDGDAQDRHAEAIREAKALLDRCRLSNSAARFVSGFENYLSAGGETLADLRPSLFVQRGEKLRQEIAAYEGGQQDSFLEPIADDLLIDLKGWRSAHNMAVGLDPVLMRLDTAMLGPDVKPTLIAPSELHAFVADADEADILDEGVREIVDEAIDLAPAIPDANDRRTVWSVESVQNLVIEAFSVALNHPGKAVVGAAAAAVVLPKVTVFGAVAAGVTGFLPAAKFLINYRDWIETKLNNTPTWKSLFIQLCDSLQGVTPFKPKSGDDGI